MKENKIEIKEEIKEEEKPKLFEEEEEEEISNKKIVEKIEKNDFFLNENNKILSNYSDSSSYHEIINTFPKNENLPYISNSEKENLIQIDETPILPRRINIPRKKLFASDSDSDIEKKQKKNIPKGPHKFFNDEEETKKILLSNNLKRNFNNDPLTQKNYDNSKKNIIQHKYLDDINENIKLIKLNEPKKHKKINQNKQNLSKYNPLLEKLNNYKQNPPNKKKLITPN